MTRSTRTRQASRIPLWLSLVVSAALGAVPSFAKTTSRESTPDRASEVRSGAMQQALEIRGALPLRFEANQGQVDSRVRFLSRGRGHTLFLTPSEAVSVLN